MIELLQYVKQIDIILLVKRLIGVLNISVSPKMFFISDENKLNAKFDEAFYRHEIGKES